MNLSSFYMKKVFFVFLVCSFIIACAPQSILHKEPLKEKGEIIIYLQPMTHDANNLSFTIDTLSIISDDGHEVHLPMSINNIEGSAHEGVQKLLASGTVPQGMYTAVRLKVSKAIIKGKTGEAALLVAEEPVTIKHLFQMTRKKASVLFLNLDASKFISEDFMFTPSFTLDAPGKELQNLLGYITGTDSNIISIFNKKTMLNVGAIATGRAPKGIVLDQSRGRAYAAISGDDVIAVINVSTGEINGKITLNAGDDPQYLSLTPDGRVLVSVNYGSNTVSIIDTNGFFEDERIYVGEDPISSVIDPLGLRAYIMDSMSSSISVIDLSAKVLSATIAVEGTPFRGAFSRNGDRLYVINKDTPNLTVINPSSLAVTGKIFIATGASSIKVDTRTDLILVGNQTSGEIIIVDSSSSIFIDTIKTGGAVAFMTIDNEENTLFAVMPDRKILQKINLTSKKIIAEINLPEGAHAVVVMGER